MASDAAPSNGDGPGGADALGARLVSAGRLTQAQLTLCENLRRQREAPLRDVLVEFGFLTMAELEEIAPEEASEVRSSAVSASDRLGSVSSRYGSAPSARVPQVTEIILPDSADLDVGSASADEASEASAPGPDGGPAGTGTESMSGSSRGTGTESMSESESISADGLAVAAAAISVSPAAGPAAGAEAPPAAKRSRARSAFGLLFRMTVLGLLAASVTGAAWMLDDLLSERGAAEREVQALRCELGRAREREYAKDVTLARFLVERGARVLGGGDPITAGAFFAEALRRDDEARGRGLLHAVTTGPLRLQRTLRLDAPTAPAAFSADGKRIALAEADGAVALRETDTGRAVARLAGHGGPVEAVAWSADGRLVAAAGRDRTVRLWDAATFAPAGRIEGLPDAVVSLVFTPTGSRLVGAAGREVLVWDATTGERVHRLEGHEGDVTDVAASADGRWIASASDDRTVRVWDAETGAPQHALAAHASRVHAVAFGPRGRWVASASRDRTVRLWDLEKGEAAAALEAGAEVRSVAFSGDGRLLVGGGHDGVLRAWDAASGRAAFGLGGLGGLVQTLAFSPDGARLLTVAAGERDAREPATRRFTVRIFDARPDRGARLLRGHEGAAMSVAFSADGKLLASAGRDETVRLWSTASGELDRTLRYTNCHMLAVGFGGAGKLAAGNERGEVSLRDFETRESAFIDGPPRVAALAFSPDGTRLALAGGDGSVRLWDPSTRRELQRLRGHEQAVRDVAWTSDGGRLASVGADGKVVVWSGDTGAPIGGIEPGRGELTAVAWSGGDRLLATGGADGVVRLWTGGSLEPFAELEPGGSGAIGGLAFDPESRWLAAGAADGTVTLWERAGDSFGPWPRLVLPAHAGAVHDVAFDAGGQWLASAGADAGVRLWAVAELVAFLKRPPEALRRAVTETTGLRVWQTEVVPVGAARSE